jgi:hypothetical protein
MGVSGMAEEPKREDRNDTELAKMYFEYFKHFTTLSATAAVGVAALRNIADIGDVLLGLCLAAFGVTLVLSVLGMQASLRSLRRGETLQEMGSMRLMVATNSFVFLMGIWAFTSPATTKLSPWVVLAVGVLASSVLVWRSWRGF